MKTLWIVISFLSVLPHLAEASYHEPQAPKSEPNINHVLAQFERYAESTFQKMRVPGTAIAVIYRNEIVFIKSYGVKRSGKKDLINNDTLFQLGSVSKPLSATLATVLASRNHFHIDDPLEKHLPHFELKLPAKARTLSKRTLQNLKIRNLLNHTSGVPRAGFNALIEGYMPFSQIVNKLQNTPTRCHSGHCYDYHNVMFSMIGEVITAATRLTFTDALSQHILRPLNMRRTSTSFAALSLDPNKAHPHVRNERGVLVPCSNYSQSYYAVAPAGGVNSTIQDMATFLQAQMGKFPEVVNSEAIALMHEPQISTPDVLSRMSGQRVKHAYYGLGWRIINFANEKVVFHGGWLKGFNNVVAFLPEHEVGIVILQNAETRFAWQNTIKFFELYLNLPEQSLYRALPAKKKHRKPYIKPLVKKLKLMTKR